MSAGDKKWSRLTWCLAGALCLSIVPVFLYICFCTPSYVECRAGVTPGADGYIKLYYLEKKDKKSWQDLKSIKSAPLKKGVPAEISLRVPVTCMKFLKMELQCQEKGTHLIENLTLRGIKKRSCKKLKIDGTSGGKTTLLSGKKMLVHASSPQSSVVFKVSGTLWGAKDYKRPGVFIFSGISLVLFTLLLLRMGRRNKDERKRDLFLIVFFLLLLSYPCLDIDTGDIAVNENRKKAAFPSFIKNKSINNDFGKQFDAWFSDRFCGRDPLIFFWRELQRAINTLGPEIMNGWIVKGHCGWYFFQLDNSMENFQNLHVFSLEELQRNLKHLVALRDACESNGIRFYYMILPDKNKIYGEMVPYFTKIRPDSESRAAQWVRYIRENSDIKVIYPVEEFKKLKNRELIYYKTDTHWNKAGAYYGYQELFKVLQKEFPRLQCRKPWKVLIEKGHRGDMNVLSPDFVPQDKTHYNCPVPEPPFQKIHNQKIDYDFSNPSGTYSLFLLRDSFSNNLLPFLYSSFNRVRSTWRYALRPGEALQLKQKKVDILILEHVERYLPKAMAQLREKSTDPKAGGK